MCRQLDIGAPPRKKRRCYTKSSDGSDGADNTHIVFEQSKPTLRRSNALETIPEDNTEIEPAVEKFKYNLNFSIFLLHSP
jgi:hypothetical protein